MAYYRSPDSIRLSRSIGNLPYIGGFSRSGSRSALDHDPLNSLYASPELDRLAKYDKAVNNKISRLRSSMDISDLKYKPLFNSIDPYGLYQDDLVPDKALLEDKIAADYLGDAEGLYDADPEQFLDTEDEYNYYNGYARSYTKNVDRLRYIKAKRLEEAK